MEIDMVERDQQYDFLEMDKPVVNGNHWRMFDFRLAVLAVIIVFTAYVLGSIH